MSDAEIHQIVQNVLQYDLDPPSEAYGSYDYGLSVSRGLPPESVALLIADSLKSLPSTLAESFIEGVLEGSTVPHLEGLLFNALLHVREVSSAGLIVAFLLDRCKVNPMDLADRLLSGIRATAGSDTQNAYAYAFLSMFRNCGLARTTAADWSRDETTLDELIERVISSTVLTDYARETLESCKQRKR